MIREGILRSLFGILINIVALLLVGTIVMMFVGSLFPVFAWLDWVKLAGSGMVVVLFGIALGDFNKAMNQRKSKQDEVKITVIGDSSFGPGGSVQAEPNISTPPPTPPLRTGTS